MGIGKKSRQRANGPGKPTQVNAGAASNPGPTRRTGREQLGETPTNNPRDIADPVARVIRKRS